MLHAIDLEARAPGDQRVAARGTRRRRSRLGAFTSERDETAGHGAAVARPAGSIWEVDRGNQSSSISR
jgi:hypothetical protein